MPAGDRGGPYAITVDGAGRVLVSEINKDTMAMLDPRTEQLQVFPLPSQQRRHTQGDRRRPGAALVHGLAQRASGHDRITRSTQGAREMRLHEMAGHRGVRRNGGAHAQGYPTKPVYLYIPFAAGGPTDTLGRNLAQVMGKSLKQSVIVENVVGAGGTIAVARAPRRAPDGYTVLLHHIGMSTAPSLYRTLSFDPLKDFEYIGEVADVPMTLIARGDFPAANFKEFLAYIKANKDKALLRERRPGRGFAPVRAAVHDARSRPISSRCPTRARARR